MAEAKKTEAAAAAAPPEAACLTLRQKLVEMRKACPEIVKKQHSDGVSYKYAKIYDVWEKITPIMNELGVDFDVISEQATRHAENGDPVYWITMQTKTRNGDKLMFLYEADLTIRWLNLDNDDETIEATVHAVGWNDDPAKAKGAAHTYALKYYLFEKFTVDQGEDDPDNSDFGAQGKGSGAGGRQQATQGRQGQSSGRLSDAQLARLYKKAEAAGMTKERTNARIVEKYKKQDPATLTRQEYDEICTSLDNAAAQHNQQGGNAYADASLTRIPPHVDRPDCISVSGLDSICKLIRTELEKVGTTIMVQVKSNDTVEVMTTYLSDFSRNTLYRAKADAPGLRTGFRGREVALIELRSLCIPNEGTAYLLDLLSRMTNENSVSTNDNGVTQTVEARQGVALNALIEIKPRVMLRPFRTFLEVEQPESEFLLRVDPDEGIGFFEADGGIWKLEAKKNIADYFLKNMGDLIDAGKVVVMQ